MAKLVVVCQPSPVKAGRTLGGALQAGCRSGSQDEHDAKTRAEAAEILNPLAGRQAPDVGDGNQRQPTERHRRHKGPLIDKVRRCRSAGEGKNPRHVHQQDRNVEQVVRPVTPAREKSVRLSELLPRPEVDAAFTWMPSRQNQHRDGLWNEKCEKCEHPQRERHPAVNGDRRHVVDVYDRNDLEENQIPSAESAGNRLERAHEIEDGPDRPAGIRPRSRLGERPLQSSVRHEASVRTLASR